ncbi:MAG: DNA-packaging protein [Bacillaceae bacterium]|nr:MAG: DNA-packaging protein [Bacillaceae bacterium]
MSSPSIENMKIPLGINDTSQDPVLNFYLSRATNFVKEYCNIEEINSPIGEIVEDIAIFLYKNKGVENIQSETKGSLSETYRENLPPYLVSRLNNYRRMKFI